MNREELYFPSVDDIEELVASFHALEVMGQIVVIKGISTKEEYGFVTWQLADYLELRFDFGSDCCSEKEIPDFSASSDSNVVPIRVLY